MADPNRRPGANRQLTTIALPEEPDAWRAAGFDVDERGRLQLGRTVLVLGGAEGPTGWAIEGVDGPIDGLATCDPVAAVHDATPHPNGVTSIDHVVVLTGDNERSVSEFEAAGFEVRGRRSTTNYGDAQQQTFFWAGDVIIELVGPEVGAPPHDQPTSIFGLALAAADLDRTVEELGTLLGTPKDAVQPGRRIAGLRGAKVGIRLPVAIMSHHVRGA
jgi:hypothetical protein